MANAASHLPESESTWWAFKDIQISKSIETTYSSLGTGAQISDRPWTFVRLFADRTLPEGFNLEHLLSDSGTMIINTFEHKHDGSFELVVATPCPDVLSEIFQGFKIDVGYDPFKPAEEDITIRGLSEAKERARITTLNKAAEVTRLELENGPAECYRKAIEKAGLKTELERAILIWDIHQSKPRILKTFTQNLLYFGLACCDRYDALTVQDILKRDENDWLQPFRNDLTHVSWLLTVADFPIGTREEKEKEQQITSLFRMFLEFSGGKLDCRQHKLGMDYTTSQNASLCASILGIPCTRQFEPFDPEEMQDALSGSQLFAKHSKSHIPNTLHWGRRMMECVPIGFPDNHLNLPSQLFRGFGAQQVLQWRFHFEHIYHELPSLRKEENNILVLLSWSSICHGQTLEVLRDWIKSVESLNLYQRLIEDLRLQQTPEEFALTLAALLCRERLLQHTVDDTVVVDTTQPIGGSYLADMHAILNGQNITNRRTVFERMISSLMRVLCTLNTSEKTVRFLMEVLEKEAPLELLDGITDQYCTRKIQGHNHDKAFEEVTKGLGICMEVMFPDRNADSEWTMI